MASSHQPFPVPVLPGVTDTGTRIFGLDVARALAILMVLVAHQAWFIGAWTHHPAPLAVSLAGPFGVELFFGLSGWLIGGLLLDIVERAPGWRNLGIFLVRRWLRTLPLYFTWLAVLFVMAPPRGLWAWHALHYATLTQNLTHGMPPGDFFAVSWSLTVEEWFYALFGVAALGAVIVTRSRWAFVAAVAVFLLVPAWMRWRVPLGLDYGNSIEKVALLNLDGIARGVLLAVLLRKRRVPSFLALPLAVVGLAMIAAVWTGHLPVSPAIFRTFVMSVVGTGWLLCFPAILLWQTSPGLLGGGVRWLSRIAYGLYIVHYSVLEHAHDHLPVAAAIAVGLVLPFALAAVSWRVIEAPVLRMRPRQVGLSFSHGA